MMLIGAWMKKRGIIDESGKRCLTDLCVTVTIPCNIFKSCLIAFNLEIYKMCSLLLLSAILMQGICLFLNKRLFNRYPAQQKKVLQYCTIVPMSGFLGNPIAEGIYDQIRVLYTSIFLIPMRVVMWSVGTILADVEVPSIFSKDTILFSVFRLIALPAISLSIGVLLGLDSISLGISVLMTGMPAGATAAIFAARYESDAPFAAKCVVMTTLASMITLSIWCYAIGA